MARRTARSSSILMWNPASGGPHVAWVMAWWWSSAPQPVRDASVHRKHRALWLETLAHSARGWVSTRFLVPVGGVEGFDVARLCPEVSQGGNPEWEAVITPAGGGGPGTGRQSLSCPPELPTVNEWEKHRGGRNNFVAYGLGGLPIAHQEVPQDA